MQILAIDIMKEGSNEKTLAPHLPNELAETVGLYLEEKIRTFYFRKDRPGVVFIMESDSIQDAELTLARLPLVKEGLMEFQLIPIDPLTPLKLLFQGNSIADF